MGFTVSLELGNPGLSYTIHQHPKGFGLYVIGGIPVTELVALSKAWRKAGLTHVSGRIAMALGASIAATDNGPLAEQWEKEINDQAAMLPTPAERWLASTNVGMSALTLFLALADGEPRVQATRRLGGGTYLPTDSASMALCVLLLDAIPEWRGRLAEVPAAFPKWAPFVAEWPALEALLASDRQALDVRLRQLSKEGDERA